MSINIGEVLLNLWQKSGFNAIFVGFADGGWQNLVMLIIACVLLYLGIVKKFEPLLLVGIAFGCLLSNLPLGGLYHQELWDNFMNPASDLYHSYGAIMREGGLLDIFYIGVKTSLYPCLIFMGVGAMTDFGPLLSNPKSLLLGAAAQLGVFVAFLGGVLLRFTGPQSASIGIIGGADGPTAIFLTTRLAPELLGAIAVAAYSYMALIPLIQPPIMNLLTSAEDRKIKMVQTRTVSKAEKIIFPIVVVIFVALLLPDTAPLIGCLMLGNLFKETGATDRLSEFPGFGFREVHQRPLNPETRFHAEINRELKRFHRVLAAIRVPAVVRLADTRENRFRPKLPGIRCGIGDENQIPPGDKGGRKMSLLVHLNRFGFRQCAVGKLSEGFQVEKQIILQGMRAKNGLDPCADPLSALKLNPMTLSIIDTDGVHRVILLQRGGKTRGRVLSAGKKNHCGP